ncbi:WW domain-binding protein 4 [Hippocampus zosterae]|uniref:WW domain-binding protein 4 n=1 Tax=Hippocampus zosterae TaxID=109293 RepID=UPI00223CDC77|nr:WW domain-binding protein 4 [Hippocampus zosterae]
MADYWKSQPRKFCQYCKCWIADNKPSIEFHERGKNHKENVAAKISEIKKKSVQKAKQEDRMSKQFAAMEEAALKAYQEDLKRMEMDSGTGPCVQTTVLPQPKAPPVVLCEPPPHKKYQKKTEKPKKSSGEQNRTQSVCWVEGRTDDGHVYYYNTVTGDSQWDRPEGFMTGSYFVQHGQHKNSSGSAWMEGVSPEGYTYWYHTETGESRWEKPNYLPPTDETPKSSLASGSEKALQEELTSGDSGCNEAPLSRNAEVTEQPTLPSVVPENSFRKRKAEGESSGKDEEDQTSNNIPQEDVKEEKKEVQNTTSEPGVKKQEEVAKAKKPKSLNPYGAWEQIKEEKDPYTIVDLQLPKVGDEDSAPKELPPEPKPKFKERIITSLGVEGGPTSFKKTKSQNGKSRSFRQRDNDD